MIADFDRKVQALEQDVPTAVCVRGRPDRRPLVERMALHRTPGLSVAVVNDGRIEWTRSYGTTSAAGGDPVDERTLFQAASISKPVAAFAAMILADQGKIDLDADVRTILRSWRLPPGPLAERQPVTPRQILSHTAGLTMQGVWGYTPGELLPSTVQILDGAPPTNEAVRVTTQPGTEFRYSGGGYTVLELLIAEVVGQPFVDFAREAVLDRCEMRDSTFAQPLPVELEAFAASGHTSIGTTVPGRWSVLPALAAGGLWTTAADLARFVIETQRAIEGRSLLLSRSMAAQMLAPQPIGPAALGFWLEGEGGSARFFHGGSNVGYQAQAVGYLDGGRGAVVMTNGDGGGSVCLGVLNRIAEIYDWPGYIVEKDVAEVESAVLDRFIGEYEVAGMRAVLRRDGDALVVTAPGFEVGRLYPESEMEFFFSDMDGGVAFEPDGAGGMRVTVRIVTTHLKGVRC